MSSLEDIGQPKSKKHKPLLDVGLNPSSGRTDVKESNDKKKRKVPTFHKEPTSRKRKQPRRKKNYLERKPVPRSIDVLEFAHARQHELNMLKKAVDESSKGNRRVFQLLPRHLRRRTMSHNLHRIPSRYRAAAAREIANMEKKEDECQKKNRRARRKPSAMSSRYQSRQMKINWLETHLWQAKRMHMMNLWGYRLAVRPTDKGIRSTYKAGIHLCTLYDASYHNVIALNGLLTNIVDVIANLTDNVEPKSQRLSSPCNQSSILLNKMYVDGCREGSFLAYHPFTVPVKELIGPIRFHWQSSYQPDSITSTLNCSEDGSHIVDPSDRNLDEINSSVAGNVVHQTQSHRRTLWLWVHAAIFQEMLQLLSSLCANQKKGTSDIVDQLQEMMCVSGEYEDDGVTVTNMEGKILRFELRGNHCHRVLRESLRPQTKLLMPHLEAQNRSWSYITDYIRTAGSLPRHCILALHVSNIRTIVGKQMFAPDNLKVKYQHVDTNQNTLSDQTTTISSSTSETTGGVGVASGESTLIKSKVSGIGLSSFPSEVTKLLNNPWPMWLAYSELFENHVLEKIIEQAGRKKKPCRGRHDDHATLPSHISVSSTGTSSNVEVSVKCNAGEADIVEEIPILLIQQPGGGPRGLHCGWDVIVPAGWGKDFWRCFVYGGARVIGLNDRRRLAIENRLETFPEDYPDTRTGRAYENLIATMEKEKFQRKPAGKRVNFYKYAVDFPFGPGWFSLFGVSSPKDFDCRQLVESTRVHSISASDSSTTTSVCHRSEPNKGIKANGNNKSNTGTIAPNSSNVSSPNACLDGLNNPVHDQQCIHWYLKVQRGDVDVATPTYSKIAITETKFKKQAVDEVDGDSQGKISHFEVGSEKKQPPSPPLSLCQTQHQMSHVQHHPHPLTPALFQSDLCSPPPGANPAAVCTCSHVCAGILLAVEVFLPRGCPTHNAMICKPTPLDFSQWLTQYKQWVKPFQMLCKTKRKQPDKVSVSTHSPKPKIVAASASSDPESHTQEPELLSHEPCRSSSHSPDNRLSDSTHSSVESSPSREVIGFLNYGTNSFARGNGYGRGFVAKNKLTSLWQAESQTLEQHSQPDVSALAALGKHYWVLVRNTTSLCYFPAFLRVKRKKWL